MSSPAPYSRLPSTGTTIFTVMSRMAAEHDAVNLSQGFPDFPVAPELIERVEEAMRAGYNQYAPMAGHPPLLSRIADKLSWSYGIAVDPETEITITAGATEALFAAILALVRPGDEVILLEPAYDSYGPAVEMAGGIPIPIPLDFPSYHIPWDRVEEALSPNASLLIVNSPHNPSGTILSEDDLQAMEQLLERHPIYLLGDEVYENIVFDGERHHSLLSRAALRERSVSAFSFGKTFHTTGWKVGYAVAPPALTAEIRKIHQFLTFSVNTPVQQALAVYLEDERPWRELSGLFQAKRDQFLNLLEGSGWTPLPCRGTYFQLLTYDQQSEERDTTLAQRLIQQYGVAAIPLSSLYHNHTDHHVLRFCFAKQSSTLQAGAELLQKVWK